MCAAKLRQISWTNQSGQRVGTIDYCARTVTTQLAAPLVYWRVPKEKCDATQRICRGIGGPSSAGRSSARTFPDSESGGRTHRASPANGSAVEGLGPRWWSRGTPSDQEDRTAALARRLEGIGVADFRLVSISREHAMLDSVTMDPAYNLDLCIIGGGVGAANVLWQLRNVSCPCIDVGFVLDTLAFPKMRNKRLYCVNDGEWDAVYGTTAPPWRDKFDDPFSQFSDVRNGTWRETDADSVNAQRG